MIQAGSPRKKKLLIAEHERQIVYDDPEMQRIFGNLPPYLHQKKVLSYDILIYLWSIADFQSRSPLPSLGPSPPSSDADFGHDGNPDRGHGESRGVVPRLHGFYTQGVEDGGTAPAAEAGPSGVHMRRTAPRLLPQTVAPLAEWQNRSPEDTTARRDVQVSPVAWKDGGTTVCARLPGRP